MLEYIETLHWSEKKQDVAWSTIEQSRDFVIDWACHCMHRISLRIYLYIYIYTYIYIYISRCFFVVLTSKQYVYDVYIYIYLHSVYIYNICMFLYIFLLCCDATFLMPRAFVYQVDIMCQSPPIIYPLVNGDLTTINFYLMWFFIVCYNGLTMVNNGRIWDSASG
jgi:hypothetical protein